MRDVFDQEQLAAPAKRDDRIHVAGVAAEMHDHHALVRGVIARSIVAALIVSSCALSQSASTGSAPPA